ncbi:MAG: MBL fold metallo-hydrolase, partial [Candidatus Odinarchaeia archaeon]
MVIIKLFDGVHFLNLGISNSYLILGDGCSFLVDTGLPSKFKKIVDYYKKIGADINKLRMIILTHHHPDHSGSANILRKITGCK